MPQPGYVYVLTNEAMPGVVKIGRTTKGVKVRLAQINAYLGRIPDIPAFEVAFYAQTKDCVTAEARMHLKFAEQRIPPGRSELFRVDLDTVRHALRYRVGKVVDQGEPDWPWGEPKPYSRRRARYRGGYPVYCWLRDHYDDIVARMNQPGFSWPQIAYEIGVQTMEEGKPFRPLPPNHVEAIWERAASAQEAFGWNPFSHGKSNNKDEEPGPTLTQGAPTQREGAGEAFSALPVDEGQPGETGGGVQAQRTAMVSTDQGHGGSRAD